MEGWQNRVVERKRARVGDFKKNRYNPKVHPAKQQTRMRAILDR